MNYIDTSYLKDLSRGDTGFLMKTIDSFISLLRETVPKIESSFLNKQWTDISSEAHNLKSSADLMGIITLNRGLMELEEECIQQKVNKDLVAIHIEYVKDISGKIVRELELEKQNLNLKTNYNKQYENK